jgi:hypothetical protein
MNVLMSLEAAAAGTKSLDPVACGAAGLMLLGLDPCKIPSDATGEGAAAVSTTAEEAAVGTAVEEETSPLFTFVLPSAPVNLTTSPTR